VRSAPERATPVGGVFEASQEDSQELVTPVERGEHVDELVRDAVVARVELQPLREVCRALLEIRVAGGRIVIEGAPAPLGPLELLDRGALQRLEGQALVSGLSPKIGKRELGVVREGLAGRFPEGAHLRELLQVVEVPKPVGPGNALSVIARCDHVTEVFTTFGERGVAAETVASEAADTARTWLDSGTPVAAHTADQLLVPMAVAGGGVFRTTPLSLHTRTNIDVIARFGGVRFDVQAEAGGFGWRVTATRD
jgi:RNA 3'-terminal phosphate cyclase (ATP)